MHNKNIQAVIFDLGGVLLNLDENKTREGFAELGIGSESSVPNPKFMAFFHHFEMGKISATDFRNGVKSLATVRCTDDDVDSVWNAMLGDLPLERLEMVKNLKQKMPVFLLSNTNEIHIDWFWNYLNNNMGVESFTEAFDKIYLSHEVGMRKPNCDIFEHVLYDQNLVAGNTLFIDDMMPNVEGARKCGLMGHKLERNNGVEELILQILT